MELKAVDAGLLQSRYRLTKQRAAVLRALGDGRHLSAETILERVRADLPGVSLGTIYRTLDILREIGLVQIFSYGGHAALYEATLEKHHHLLCTNCRRIENIQADGLGRIAQETALERGYADVDYALTIVGRCAACATNGSSTSAGRSSSSGGNSA